MTKCIEIDQRLNAINPWLQTSVEDLLRIFGKPGALLKYRRMQEILNDPDWVAWLKKTYKEHFWHNTKYIFDCEVLPIHAEGSEDAIGERGAGIIKFWNNEL
jgi:hypothetical protein